MMRIKTTLLFFLLGMFVLVACNDNDNDGLGTEADNVGIGAQCAVNDDCLQPENDTEPVQLCLAQFKGGYCGISDCTSNLDCPDGSACIAHDDGTNYCFRRCIDKNECNLNRTEDFASNCSSNVSFVDTSTSGKACVPPSN